MGQDILDGNLPYTVLGGGGNKPPLAYAAFALFILFSGKSIVGIRMAGTLCILASTWATYRIGVELRDQRTGFIAALLFALFSTLSGGKATLTEHIALVPTMFALYLLLAEEGSTARWFTVGVLLSVAALVRVDLVPLGLAVGLAAVSQSAFSLNGVPIRRLLALVAGGLLPPMLISAVYFYNGVLDVLIKSAVLAPLDFARSGRLPFTTFKVFLHRMFLGSNLLLGAGVMGGSVLVIKHWNSFDRTQRMVMRWSSIFFVSIGVAVINSPGGHNHHFILLTPFLALLAGYFFSRLYQSWSALAASTSLTVILVASAYLPIGPEYKQLVSTLVRNEPLFSDTGYRLGEYLKRANPSRQPMYLMHWHIAHWFTDTKPLLHSVVHPSTIGKPLVLQSLISASATPETELRRLLALAPLYIVKNKDEWYLEECPEAKRILEETLAKKYTLVEQIGFAYIYERKSQT